MRRSVSRIRPVSSRSAVSRSWRWALELLDVLQRLLVLLLGQRVDRAELLAAALQALDPGVELGALAVRERLSDGSGGRPSFVARRLSSAVRVLRVVARLLRPDLAARDLLAVLLDARVDARLLGGALAQLGGELLARGAVGGQLGLEDLEPGGDRLAARLQRRGEPLGDRNAAPRRAPAGSARCSSFRARSARSRWARSARRFSVAIAASTWARRSALGPSSGAARRCWITQRAWRSASAASSRARAAARASRSIASRAASAAATFACAASTCASAARSACAAASTSLSSASRRLRSVSTRSAPPAEDLAQLARGGRPDAPVAGDRDAAEGGVERLDVVDDPDVGEQRRGELGGVADVGEQRLGAARGRGGARRRRRRRRARGVVGGGERRRPGNAGMRGSGARARRPANGDAASRRRAAKRRRRAIRRRAAAGTISAAPPSLPARSSSAAPDARSGATAARRRGPRAAASASS